MNNHGLPPINGGRGEGCMSSIVLLLGVLLTVPAVAAAVIRRG
jgi:hypothetical protein